jgi:hypothetical protein
MELKNLRRRRPLQKIEDNLELRNATKPPSLHAGCRFSGLFKALHKCQQITRLVDGQVRQQSVRHG